MFYDLEDKKPKNSGENWVAPNAVVIGDVTLEKNTSVWFNATLRGDIENIHIGEGSNVQDSCVLHTDPGYPCLLYTSPSPRDLSTSRMPSSA